MSHFNASSVVDWVTAYDPSRLVDTDSGGPANNLHVRLTFSSTDPTSITHYSYIIVLSSIHSTSLASQRAANGQVGDVNDIHDYPYPQDPKPNDNQYAMIGEFGGE